MPSFRARYLAVVDFPLPAGPSMAMIRREAFRRGIGLQDKSLERVGASGAQRFFQRTDALFVLGQRRQDLYFVGDEDVRPEFRVGLRKPRQVLDARVRRLDAQ